MVADGAAAIRPSGLTLTGRAQKRRKYSLKFKLGSPITYGTNVFFVVTGGSQFVRHQKRANLNQLPLSSSLLSARTPSEESDANNLQGMYIIYTICRRMCNVFNTFSAGAAAAVAATAMIEAVASPIDPIARVVHGFDGQTPTDEERSAIGEIVVPLQEVSLEPPLLNEIVSAENSPSDENQEPDWEEVEKGTRKGSILIIGRDGSQYTNRKGMHVCMFLL